jgi:hypothetical protein
MRDSEPCPGILGISQCKTACLRKVTLWSIVDMSRMTKIIIAIDAAANTFTGQAGSAEMELTFGLCPLATATVLTRAFPAARTSHGYLPRQLLRERALAIAMQRCLRDVGGGFDFPASALAVSSSTRSSIATRFSLLKSSLSAEAASAIRNPAWRIFSSNSRAPGNALTRLKYSSLNNAFLNFLIGFLTDGFDRQG